MKNRIAGRWVLRALLMVLPIFVPESGYAQSAPDLLDVARDFVETAEASRGQSMLWGRIAGSRAEHQSARILEEGLAPYVGEAHLESFAFHAHRPRSWRLEMAKGGGLDSAMPAPFDARFPPDVGPLEVTLVADDNDWSKVAGKWAFVEAEMDGAPSRTSVRRGLLYQRAVEAKAAGFVFSLPTPPGLWRVVVPVDKPYSKKDTFFPDGVRPIPSFYISSDDGARLRRTALSKGVLSSSIAYGPDRLEGFNAEATLEGQGELNVMLMAHLDSFFSGANDDATGLAALVGLAHRLGRLPKERRLANFTFVGISGHHDEAAGMRAFIEENPERMGAMDQVFLLEHLDARHGDLAGKTDWPEDLNEARAAYTGLGGWPEVEAALPALVRDTGLMKGSPTLVQNCIADLFVICGQTKTFCLIEGPPFYHTNHDTMDKISREGIEAGVEFYTRLFEKTGALAAR